MSTSSEERRTHKRHEIACPVHFFSSGGEALVQGKTVNISDGGALVSIPKGFAPKAEVNLTLSVPRTTPSTYMLEDFATVARVIRRHDLPGREATGVAVHFNEPLNLAIEV